MREIKFRAWDKKDRRLFQVEYLGLNDVHAFDDIGRESTDFELMQYTGLRDKNGTEIYEGDVLEHPTMGISRTMRGSASPLRIIVAWAEYTHSDDFDMDYIFGWTFESCNPCDMNIIGNIYETPKLSA